MKRITAVLLVLALLLGLSPVVLAAHGAVDDSTVWRYLDDNTDPAWGASDRTAWTAEDYDDSGWKTGSGPFGSKKGKDTLGGYQAATVLSGCTGSESIPAYFFRTTFTVADLEGMTQLQGTAVYDDAMIVYLNGVRVMAFNDVQCDADSGDSLDTPIGENLQYGGLSIESPNVSEVSITDLSMLHPGENTLAVEIHQNRADSSDIWFDLDLTLTDAPVKVQTDIALFVGADETQRNVTWYAADSQPGKLLLAQASELEAGQMPENAAQFTSLVTKANDADRYSHQLTVTGLEPDTAYAYQLVNTAGASAVMTFTTGGHRWFHLRLCGGPANRRRRQYPGGCPGLGADPAGGNGDDSVCGYGLFALGGGSCQQGRQ